MKTAAQLISFLFHPLIIPTLGIYLLFQTDSYLNYAIPSGIKNAILLLIGITTFIIPTLISLLLLNKKVINSLEMENKKERIIPYSFTILFYFFTLYMLNQSHVPPIILKFMIGTTISIILAFIINFKWKISAHMIAMGGLLGALIIVSLILQVYVLPTVALVILITGLLGSSRLILNVHTPAQIILGFVLGFVCQVSILYF